MSNLIKKIVGKALWGRLRSLKKRRAFRSSLELSYHYDQMLLEQFASPQRDFRRTESRHAFVVMLYHSLEKGMALPAPRAGFGEGKAKMLVEHLEILVNDKSRDGRVPAAIRVLETWLRWNRQRDVEFEDLSERCQKLIGTIHSGAGECWRKGGVTEVTKQDHLRRMRGSVEGFFESRHSIRSFSSDAVEDDLIRNAIRIAQTSPSLCNRQSCHVHQISRGTLMSKALELQGGNSGFSDVVDKVLVVTSELGCFLSVGERNQCWVEGGLFAMALLCGLHEQGLGACCLNWAKEPEEDRAIHKLLGLPRDQRVVMFIAVGHLPECFSITHSPRRDIQEIFHSISTD